MNLIGYVRGKLWNEHGTWNRFPSSWSVVSGPVTTVGGTRCLLCAGCLAMSLVYTHSECVLPFGTIYACMHACMCVCMYVCMCECGCGCGCGCRCVCMCVYVCEHIHYLNFIYILHYHSFSFSLCQDWHSSQKGTPILAFFSRHCWQHPQICQTWLLQIVGWNFQLPLGLPSSPTELNFSSYGETWWEFHQQSLSMNWTQRLV